MDDQAVLEGAKPAVAGSLVVSTGLPATAAIEPRAPLAAFTELVDEASTRHLAGRCARLLISIAHDHLCIAGDSASLGEQLIAEAEASARNPARGARAQSPRLEVEVCSQGLQRRWSFVQGVLRNEGEVAGACEDEGSCVRLWPAAELPSRAAIEAVLEPIHWLCPTLRLELDGRRLEGQPGLAAWIRRHRDWDGSPVRTRIAERGDDRIELAWSWIQQGQDQRGQDQRGQDQRFPGQVGFVNLHRVDRGAHVDGVIDGLAARHRLSRADTQQHALVLIHLTTGQPPRVGAGRERLDDPALRRWIAALIRDR